jgi:branched-chain amino acid transport system ATP-binding protein
VSGALLQVRGLRAGYAETPVLHGVDLEVAAGELVALVGANGAGKSTLLKAISGLVRPWAGEIMLDGARLDRLAPPEIVGRGVAHVPERRQVFAQLTVADNLTLGAYARLGRLGRAGLRKRIEESCRLFPALGERLRSEAGHLSGGQQQMLAIARGLMAGPRVLLLDEPSLGLAPVLVEETFQVLARLRETGIGILLVEQNARASLAVADRAYVLETGRTVLSGVGQELLEMPEVVQRYLGMSGEATGDGDDARRSDLARRLREALDLAHP